MPPVPVPFKLKGIRLEIGLNAQMTLNLRQRSIKPEGTAHPMKPLAFKHQARDQADIRLPCYSCKPEISVPDHASLSLVLLHPIVDAPPSLVLLSLVLLHSNMQYEPKTSKIHYNMANSIARDGDWRVSQSMYTPIDFLFIFHYVFAYVIAA
ncbi:hypothetical protein BDR04DRAFT_1155220 [Suillus decipiens]|nr:hypothetical protein BDR04DRAFT_1155220 [Suillus decipiens]